jgi:hypothetical protein
MRLYSMPKIVLGPALVAVARHWPSACNMRSLGITAFFLVFYNGYVRPQASCADSYDLMQSCSGGDTIVMARNEVSACPARRAPSLPPALSRACIYAFHGAHGVRENERRRTLVSASSESLFSGSRLDSTAVMAAPVLIGLIALAHYPSFFVP